MEKSGLVGTYEAWAFGDAPDKLAELVLQKIKTATCSAYDFYQIDNEHLERMQSLTLLPENQSDRI